jgi:metal-sulfur cluster biosynthetic enzyme
MNLLSFLRRSPRPAPPESAGPPDGGPARADAPAEQRALEALRGVDDPELGIDVVDLGLVYGIEIGSDAIAVRLAMTSPSCPLGDHIAGEAERALRRAFPDARRIGVEIVHEPPWGPERISESGRRRLGWT